ncbi:hypothetical protein [Phormidium tenue]|uniref:Transposase n=1 Tax=Phormidium tenue FACHB-1050 TaxID=2692857 RepID=A0ABR8C4S3_9CYAN|nr:hypothetical protein [Phormidium tenue]MBD2315728.1 hypothetical protein [Phormidium tenue FACHB-1050]
MAIFNERIVLMWDISSIVAREICSQSGIGYDTTKRYGLGKARRSPGDRGFDQSIAGI